MEEPEVSLARPSPWARARLALPHIGAQAAPLFRADAVGAAIIPLGLAFAAILFPSSRPFALAIALAGFLLQRRRGSPAMWPWAAVVPLTTILTWSLIPAPVGSPDAGSCADPLSPPALWRATELGLVLVVVALVGRLLGGGHRHLPLARSDGWFVALAAAVGFVIAPLGLLLGADAARPFFGSLHLQIGLAGAIIPALIFAAANATLEETVYRGVLLGWMERNIGTLGAIVIQAAAFGLAHTGSDFISSPLPILATVSILGLLGGLVVKRTGSLFVPILIHAAFDIPLYYNLACRLS